MTYGRRLCPGRVSEEGIRKRRFLIDEQVAGNSMYRGSKAGHC